MNLYVPHPRRRAIVSIAVTLGLVFVLALSSLPAAATTGQADHLSATGESASSICAAFESCVEMAPREDRQRAITAGNASNTNVFSPISQPSVVLLVGSGIVALGVLTLMRLRETLLGTGDTEQQPGPHRPMTDADHVEQMLLDNDGYMKQSRIVEQTDWSKAKVSRLLSRMADNGTIRKDKDGRENIIILERE